MSKTILIVEDDPDVRNGLHIRLKANGYVTVLAADAPSSISQARKHSPDLIVLDLGLPGGDGFLVMDRFKANPTLAVIPIIIVSARDVHSNHQRALKAGAKAFLQKPVENAELLRVIRQTLGETDAPDESHTEEVRVAATNLGARN
jgi:DNA-binding response OmpR family regulator